VAGGGTAVVAGQRLPVGIGDFGNFRNFRKRFANLGQGGRSVRSAGSGNDATRYCA
jgi:hypothetical protein